MISPGDLAVCLFAVVVVVTYFLIVRHFIRKAAHPGSDPDSDRH